MNQTKKRKIHFSDIVVFISIFAVVAYTTVDVLVQVFTFTPLDNTLTTCWYAFWGTEIIALAAIRNSKTKHGNKTREE